MNKEKLYGRVVLPAVPCDTCPVVNTPDYDCKKIDVPGIGGLCLVKNPMEWHDIKNYQLKTGCYFVHQMWPNMHRFVFVAEYDAETDLWRPWDDIQVAGAPLDKFQREQITHVMPVVMPIVTINVNEIKTNNHNEED